MGFITCDHETPRYDATTVKVNHLFKNDVYIRLLAIKLCKYLFAHYNPKKVIDNFPIIVQEKLNSGEWPTNVRMGLGRLLVESVNTNFPDANAITLDTRLANLNARKFYEHIGFRFEESSTFKETDVDHYIGYEKTLSRQNHI